MHSSSSFYHFFCVSEVTTHYHTRRRCASSSLNCFPVSPYCGRNGLIPIGTFLRRSTRWSARTTPGSVISFCARESKAWGRGVKRKARQFTSGHRDGGASNSSLLFAVGSFVFYNVRHQRPGTFRASIAARSYADNCGEQIRALIGVYGRKISFFFS